VSMMRTVIPTAKRVRLRSNPRTRSYEVLLNAPSLWGAFFVGTRGCV
jgi:hypothetical protein